MTISGVREIKSPRREIDAERASPSAHAIDDPLRWSDEDRQGRWPALGRPSSLGRSMTAPHAT
jgi:hypothetical protein